VLGLADSIARNAPLTVAAAKAAIREVGRPDGRRDLARPSPAADRGQGDQAW
jgi:hypothetical protein